VPLPAPGSDHKSAESDAPPRSNRSPAAAAPARQDAGRGGATVVDARLELSRAGVQREDLLACLLTGMFHDGATYPGVEEITTRPIR